MNSFQQKLLSLSENMSKACQRVCKSEIISELDVDVLRQRMREMYDFLLTSDYQETIVETPVGNVFKYWLKKTILPVVHTTFL